MSAAILPEHRGGGMGSRLTRVLLDACAGHGRTEVRLTVHPANATVIGLYRRLGFNVVGEERDYFGPGEPRVVCASGSPRAEWQSSAGTCSRRQVQSSNAVAEGVCGLLWMSTSR